MSKAHQKSNLQILNAVIGTSDTTTAILPLRLDSREAIWGTLPSVNTNNTFTQDGMSSDSGGDYKCSIPPINTATQDLSVNFWIKHTLAQGTNAADRIELENLGILWRYYPTAVDGFNRRLIWDYLPYRVASRDLIDPVFMSTTSFEMITITYAAAENTYGVTRIYRNGVFWNSCNGVATATRGVMSYIAITDIGSWIRDLCVCSMKLSDEEIASLYLAGTSPSSSNEGGVCA